MPPPLPNFLGLLLGVACGWIQPWPVASDAVGLSLGVLSAAAGAALCVTTGRALKRHGTPPDPRAETTAIVATGPYRFTRNPIYIAFAIVQAGLGLAFNNGWILLTTIPATIAVHYIVVLREEAYLDAKFGDEYRRYKSRVRRWI